MGEYTANNSTGFSSDANSQQPSGPVGTGTVPESVTLSPDFELEKQRHNAVLAHQQRVIDEQKRIVQQPQQFVPQQQFAPQQQQPAPRQFRGPAPVPSSPA